MPTKFESIRIRKLNARPEGGGGDEFFERNGIRVLRALRKIIRAVDLHSRRVDEEFHVTAPQLLCLHSLAKADGMTLTALSRDVSLSASTVTGIVERLEAKGLIRSERSREDRRRVHLTLTGAGCGLVAAAPALLQDRFSAALRGLSELEQATIALSLERIVELMGVADVEASPNLLPAESLPRKSSRGKSSKSHAATTTKTHI